MEIQQLNGGLAALNVKLEKNLLGQSEQFAHLQF